MYYSAEKAHQGGIGAVSSPYETAWISMDQTTTTTTTMMMTTKTTTDKRIDCRILTGTMGTTAMEGTAMGSERHSLPPARPLP